MFIGGEAGAGKTALLHRFRTLIGDGAELIVGRCDPLSTPPPLGALLDVADRLPGPRLRMQAGHALLQRDFLAALSAGAKPLVLAFEDVHWADQATLALLAFTARRIDGCRALLIATWRDDEVPDGHTLRRMLGDLAATPAVRPITVGPLGRDGVRALVGDRGIDADALLRRTGGNPFFVTPVLAAADAQLPATVRDAVLARAARLHAAAHTLLETAAVIGSRSEPWLLEQTVEDDDSAMRDCLAAGLLVNADGDTAFRHERVREAVLEAIQPQERLVLYRRVLAALRAAELGAHREAADQYARVLRFGNALPASERAALLSRHAAECAVADRLDEAIRAYGEAARIAHAIGRYPLRGRSDRPSGVVPGGVETERTGRGGERACDRAAEVPAAQPGAGRCLRAAGGAAHARS